ncbi:hypothetical protein [Inhella sp.]|jgi:hypothetical protein|uniref:hypothetical protein n=2 Tax=Inhella sp. TaxID=1921806 RepID=UPI002625A503|nr:hypothetical protein [Inhella sp.]
MRQRPQQEAEMLKFFRWVCGTVLVLLVASLALGGWILSSANDGLQAGSWQVVVDGEPLADVVLWGDSLGDSLSDAGGVLAALLTGLLALILVPLVLLVGVGVPLLVVLVVLAAVVLGLVGGALLMVAPIAVPVLLIVWLARRQPTPTVAR